MRASSIAWARGLQPLSTTNGFSTLEWIIASTVVTIGFLGSTAFFSTMRSVGEPMAMSRALNSVADEMKPHFGQWLEDEWLAISSNACKVDAGTKFEPIERDGYTMGVMDRTYFDSVIPKSKNHNPEHPLRTAFEALIALYKERAAENCADATILNSTVIKLLGSRQAALTFCRCATAQTAYATLQNAVTEQIDMSGMYVCLFVKNKAPDPGATRSESNNAWFLSSHPLILEGYVSVVSTATGDSYACKDLALGRPSDAVARLDYTLSPLDTDGLDRQMAVRGSFLIP